MKNTSSITDILVTGPYDSKVYINYLIKNFEHFESDCQGCLESNFDESITVSESQCWLSLKEKETHFFTFQMPIPSETSRENARAKVFCGIIF